MRIALAGPPGGGRTTLFRALAGNPSADPSNPLTVQVPDPRVDLLSGHWSPKKTVRATVVFTDTPSPSLSPRMIAGLRDSSAMALVLDNYARGALLADFEACEAEMLVADQLIIEKRLERLVREGRSKEFEARVLSDAVGSLSSGRPLRTAGLEDDAVAILSPYALLTLKPLFVISNRGGAPVSDESALESRCASSGASVLPVDAAFELELAEIPEDERGDFLRSMGYDESGLSRLVRGAFEALELIVFLTMGQDEVRAWPLRRGSTALEAAGRIHSDLARGFIRAQVIAFEDFARWPDTADLRTRNLLRLEGRDYVVRDGDILEIRFSV